MDLDEQEVAVNNVGAGNLDGTGVGPKGEPGVYLKKRKLAGPVYVQTIKGFKEFTHARRARE